MVYLFVYLGIGLFIVVACLLHKEFKKDKIITTSLFLIFLWPLIVLIAPRTLFGLDSIDNSDKYTKEDLLIIKAKEYLKSKTTEISEIDKSRIARVAKYGYNEVCTFSITFDFKDIIEKLWDINLHPNIYHSYLKSIRNLDEKYDPEFEPCFSLKSPDWYIGFSNEFVKSINKIDHKKQGRILEAISKISSNPIEIMGDTIKPLNKDLKGLWRFRLADDRLVYFPDRENKKIVLITFFFPWICL